MRVRHQSDARTRIEFERTVDRNRVPLMAHTRCHFYYMICQSGWVEWPQTRLLQTRNNMRAVTYVQRGRVVWETSWNPARVPAVASLRSLVLAKSSIEPSETLFAVRRIQFAGTVFKLVQTFGDLHHGARQRCQSLVHARL